MQEWPLIVFTLLMQASVGITLFAAGMRVLAATEKGLPALRFLLSAFVAGALGLMASVAHLGYPLNMFHALAHVGSSWLSREIVFAGLYLAVLALTILVLMVKTRLSPALLLIASVLGVIDIFCMSAVYVHASVVTWTHFNTYLMFYGSALSFGAVACLWSATRCRPSPAIRRVALTAVTVAIGITLLRLLEQPIYMGYLNSLGQSDALTFPHQPLAAFEQLSSLRFVAWLILVIGTGALALSLRAQQISKKRAALAGGLIVIAEALLRFSFFSIN